MSKVYFCNMGELNPLSFKTFGLHAKVHDSPFGQFGTGLKYAIAKLLAEEREIYIKSGNETYNFHVKAQEFRGTTTEIVCVNGEAIGFTTHLGNHWELWQVYRELATNAYDENGGVLRSRKYCEGFDTVICAEIGDVAHDDVFFNEKNPKLNHAYLKGVRVYDTKIPFKQPCELPINTTLTEDRTVRFEHQVYTHALGNLITSKDKKLIISCLTDPNCYEMQVSDCWMPSKHSCPPSKEFVEILDRLQKEDRLINDLAKAMSRQLGTVKVRGFEYKPTQREVERVKFASDICENNGYMISDFPIVYRQELQNQTLAQAKDGEIILTKRLLKADNTIVLVSALIEEWAHLSYGFSDLSRNFQNWIFEELANKCINNPAERGTERGNEIN